MLGIVIVIYKSFDQILAYVRNELPKIALSWRAVIVNVGSDMANSSRIAEALQIPLVNDVEASIEDSPIVILHCADNLGYARGNNLGVKFLLKHHSAIDKLLFSNDDIELIDSNTVDVLAACLDTKPDVASIGPAVINLQDTRLPPIFNMPELWYNIRRNIGIPFLGNAAFLPPWDPQCPSQIVYTVSGCFFMVRAADFLAAGMFDARTFLYWEEEIIAARFQAIGKKVFYEPEVRIRHFVGNTTGASKSMKAMLLLLRNELAGQRLFFRDYAHAGLLPMMMLHFSALIRTVLVRIALFKHALLAARAF